MSTLTLAARLNAVRSDIDLAAQRAGRDAADITLIVVTKFHPASMVRDLVKLGVRDVGENRHQEAQQKAAEVADRSLRWHFIGQLQSNKARQAAQYAHTIHSIDRERLVTALATAEVDRPVGAFVQVNLTDDPARGGAKPELIERIAERVLETENLRLRGVMAVAPLPEEEPADRAFARLHAYSERVRRLDPRAADISAGMTHDYAAAIVAGATHLRIGSAITGKRVNAG